MLDAVSFAANADPVETPCFAKWSFSNCGSNPMSPTLPCGMKSHTYIEVEGSINTVKLIDSLTQVIGRV